MIEFINSSGGRISIQANLVTIVEEESNDLTYIVTSGNKGFAVMHSYDEVMNKIKYTLKDLNPEEIA